MNPNFHFSLTNPIYYYLHLSKSPTLALLYPSIHLSKINSNHPQNISLQNHASFPPYSSSPPSKTPYLYPANPPSPQKSPTTPSPPSLNPPSSKENSPYFPHPPTYSSPKTSSSQSTYSLLKPSS
jgi:hypothetical protein